MSENNNVFSESPDYQVIGQPRPRHDAWQKAYGETIYANDHKIMGMLYGKVLRSEYPAARLISMDTSASLLRIRGSLARVRPLTTVSRQYCTNHSKSRLPLRSSWKPQNLSRPKDSVAARQPSFFLHSMFSFGTLTFS